MNVGIFRKSPIEHKGRDKSVEWYVRRTFHACTVPVHKKSTNYVCGRTENVSFTYNPTLLYLCALLEIDETDFYFIHEKKQFYQNCNLTIRHGKF